MLFNSYIFIFGFLPIVLAGHALLRGSPTVFWPIAWLVAASLVYYAWWRPEYLLLLLFSVAVNFGLGKLIIDGGLSRSRARAVLTAGIIFNLCLLGYFKYAGFFVANVDDFFGAQWVVPNIILPIGISFITFQKIAFLVDAYRGLVRNFTPLNYTFFVTFFPQLIAGPITHHSEIMPQIGPSQRRDITADLAVGISIFVVGLFKKVVIADSLAIYADAGYAMLREGRPLDHASAWVTVLCYSFQLYYDFSGYSDMAIGLARMFGFRLPVNFYSPYKSTSIIDFWRRWHITLSQFLRDYLYIPLGGNRRGPSAEIRESRHRHAPRRALAWRQLDVRRLGRSARLDAGPESRLAGNPFQQLVRFQDPSGGENCNVHHVRCGDSGLDTLPSRLTCGR